LKRVSRRSWRLVSGTAALALVIPFGQAPHPYSRVNELTLAGLRPGRDKIVEPQKSFRELTLDPDSKDALVWGDICTHRQMRVEVDADKKIQTITLSYGYKSEIKAKCLPSASSPEVLKLVQSGHGLNLGDACIRVSQIYGKAESQSPSVKGGEKLKLLFYSFDWAGSDVPQVMEVTCNPATNQVVEIMLAAASL
jgi:hypothetical protein